MSQSMPDRSGEVESMKKYLSSAVLLLPGVFCCGPAPVRAIKEGELTFKYDVPFVYAEVNADVVEYIKLRDGRVFKMGGSPTEVGKSISNQSRGRDEREDITHNYKYPEGREPFWVLHSFMVKDLGRMQIQFPKGKSINYDYNYYTTEQAT